MPGYRHILPGERDGDADPGWLTNFFKKLSGRDLLIIHDFGMKKLDGELQNDFEQIIDGRYASKALILSSQLPVAD